MRVKMSKPPPPAPTTSAIGPCPTVIKIVGCPGTAQYWRERHSLQQMWCQMSVSAAKSLHCYLFYGPTVSFPARVVGTCISFDEWHCHQTIAY